MPHDSFTIIDVFDDVEDIECPKTFTEGFEEDDDDDDWDDDDDDD